MTWFHTTIKEKVPVILEQGLRTDPGQYEMTQTGSWAEEFYSVWPIFVSREPWSNEPGEEFLELDLRGLSLVADLPSLVDHGAYIDEGTMWWESGQEPEALKPYLEDGALGISMLLQPGSEASRAAIQTTETAAVIENISPERIRRARIEKYSGIFLGRSKNRREGSKNAKRYHVIGDNS